MFSLHYSKEKNRIYIMIQGVLSEAEFIAYRDHIVTLMDGARKGFTVLADLSLCDRSLIEKSDHFNRIREYGAKMGFKAKASVVSQEVFKAQKGDLRKDKNIFLTKEEADHYLDTL
jgi:hypothetical protein